MPPSAFLSWVQETTFCGRAAVELADRRAGGVATYLGILLALSLLTGRARAWPASRTAGGPCDGGCWKAPAALMLVAALLVGASFLDPPGRWETG